MAEKDLMMEGLTGLKTAAKITPAFLASPNVPKRKVLESTQVTLEDGTSTSFMNPGFIPFLACRKWYTLAAHLLAVEPQASLARLLTDLTDNIESASSECSMLVIELDPMMLDTTIAREKTEYSHGRPVKILPLPDKTPNKTLLDECKKMMLAQMTFLKSGGFIASEAYRQSCFFNIYPLMLTTTTTGTKKEEDATIYKNNHALEALLQRENDLFSTPMKEVVDAANGNDAFLNAWRKLRESVRSDRKLKTVDEMKKSIPESDLEILKKGLNAPNQDVLGAWLLELEEIRTAITTMSNYNRTVDTRRIASVRRARDDLSNLAFFDFATSEKWPVTEDEIYGDNEEHMFFPHAFLGAMLDMDRVAIKVVYHGDLPLTSQLAELSNPMDFYHKWLQARRTTIESLIKDEKTVATVPRTTQVFYFWMTTRMVSEFISLVFTARAAIMRSLGEAHRKRVKQLQDEQYQDTGSAAIAGSSSPEHRSSSGDASEQATIVNDVETTL